MDTTINVSDVALIFEGGGTRAANSAGVLNTLLDNGLYFKDVFGISAGSSHAINYISRDTVRARASFVEYMGVHGVAGVREFLTGHGYFNARRIYQRDGYPEGVLPFDFERFIASGSQMHIDAYEVDTDSTAHWTKADITTVQDLMNRVQASSTMPFFMPLVRFDGHSYYDGGLGSSWGIQLEEAQELGYERFFVVCTQARGYRKKPPKHAALNRALVPRYPQVAERMNIRWKHYNELLEHLEELERAGKAIVYYPDEMTAQNTERDVKTLTQLYTQGYMQAHRELPAWKNFLGL